MFPFEIRITGAQPPKETRKMENALYILKNTILIQFNLRRIMHN